ncbi:MAG: ferritin-like domain-containing protein [Myxococcales bacterium]|nr:ferritin-like domain-containing protein [Myxococcales bacterium]
MSHTIKEAGGVFTLFHRELMGEPIDFSSFDHTRHDEALLAQARAVWQNRVETEFRSTQIMNRFVAEVLGAGDPIDVYAGALDLVADEVKHTALCAGVVRALGGVPRFPDPPRLTDPPRFLEAPMVERALTTAISMVAINETLSVGYVTDLAERCSDPVIKAVLDATCGDEEGHQDFGWSYVEQSLSRFEPSTLKDWRHLVATTLQPHLSTARPLLEALPPEKRVLDAWPEQAHADLGLFSAERQAIVFQRTFDEQLAPRLRRLELFT